MPQINTLLFGDANLSAELAVYVGGVIFITLIGTYNSILQSLNQFLITVVGLLGALVLKFILNIWLVGRLNIMGASVATVLSSIFALVFILLFSPEIVKGLFNEGHFWLKLGLAITVMFFSVRLFTISYMHFIGNERSDTLVMSLGGAF